jgi:GNAT superfamily N-acetyltransferase
MIRLMGPADIPAAMRLKQAAGWNQTELDWANIMALEPEGCWVYEHDGQIAGSTTAICYGQDLAWIGMVLVLPPFRGRGFARALMEHAMRFIEQRGVRVTRLDATEMGRPLYSRLGFREESVIERWTTSTPRLSQPASQIPVEPMENVAPIAALDTKAFGADRQSVIERLLATFPTECIQAQAGYAMERPGSGARFLGPCVAEDASTACGLIETLLARHVGAPMFWDLLPENSEAVRMAQQFGFGCKRRLIRMVLGDTEHAEATRGTPALQFATAGFEYG